MKKHSLFFIFFLFLLSCNIKRERVGEIIESNKTILQNVNDTISFDYEILEKEEEKTLSKTADSVVINLLTSSTLKETVVEASASDDFHINKITRVGNVINIYFVVNHENQTLSINIENPFDGFLLERQQQVSFPSQEANSFIKYYIPNYTERKEESDYLKNTTNWKCFSLGGNEVFGYRIKCISDQDLLTSYLQLTSEEDLLLHNIPQSDTIYNIDDVDVKYSLSDSLGLNIHLIYPSSGETRYHIKNIDNKTVLNVIMYP